MTYRYPLFILILVLFLADIFSIYGSIKQNNGESLCFGADNDTIIGCTKAELDSIRQQAIVDSLMSKDLGEVTVEAQNTMSKAASTVYLPTSIQRNAAQNMAQLLQFMAIPKINVNLQDNSITDNFGREVAIFIDYLPATTEDRQGLRTADVLKVEYLEYPTDPRFRGAERVLNFFMRKYEYGGYTKLSSTETGFRSFESKNSIFSKFVYKKMTFDFFTMANHIYDSHYGVDEKSTFRIPNSDGEISVIERNQMHDHGLLNQLTLPVTLRATYQTDKVQIRNTFGYSFWNEPSVAYSGKVYNSAYNPSTGDFDYNSVYKSHGFSYTGDFYFSLPKNFSLSVNPVFKYSRNKYNSFNQNFITPDITNDSKENAITAQLELSLHKQIGAHSLNLDFQHSLNHNNVKGFYNRFFSKDRNHHYNYTASLTYQFQTSNFALTGQAGINRFDNRMNGKSTSATSPSLHLFSGYIFNDDHVVKVDMEYSSVSPAASDMVESISQSNEMLYYTGNPLLKNYNELSCYASYSWIPSNKYSIELYGSLSQSYDRILMIYTPYDDGKAVISSPINNGDFYKYTVGASFRLNLFKGSLSVNVKPIVEFYKSTGMYRTSETSFQFLANASYYFKQFYCAASLAVPDKIMSSRTTSYTKYRTFYDIKFGWGNSKWNVYIAASNFFNNGFHHSSVTLDTPIATREYRNYNYKFSRQFGISATYTFGYGKKINRGDEVGAQSGASSIVTP